MFQTPSDPTSPFSAGGTLTSCFFAPPMVAPFNTVDLRGTPCSSSWPPIPQCPADFEATLCPVLYLNSWLGAGDITKFLFDDFCSSHFVQFSHEKASCEPPILICTFLYDLLNLGFLSLFSPQQGLVWCHQRGP